MCNLFSPSNFNCLHTFSCSGGIGWTAFERLSVNFQWSAFFAHSLLRSQCRRVGVTSAYNGSFVNFLYSDGKETFWKEPTEFSGLKMQSLKGNNYTHTYEKTFALHKIAYCNSKFSFFHWIRCVCVCSCAWAPLNNNGIVVGGFPVVFVERERVLSIFCIVR